MFFQFARSLADENEFVCIEGFKDAEAGATHVKQPYVKRFFDTALRLPAYGAGSDSRLYERHGGGCVSRAPRCAVPPRTRTGGESGPVLRGKKLRT